MADIQSQEIEWLWYPFIPYGKLTIIQGDPGVKTKVSGCFRTEEGARDYLKIMSYVGTAHKQGYNAYEAIKNAITDHPDFIFEYSWF